MNDHPSARFRHLPAFSRALAVCAIGACCAIPIFAATITIPESRRPLSASERQSIRYRNSALWQRAHDLIAQEDNVAAREVLIRILANDPDNNHARVMLMHVHNRLGEYELALSLADDLIAHYPEYHDLYLERATHRLRAGQWALALADLAPFEAGAEMQEESTRMKLGLAYFQLAHYDAALRHLLAAGGLDQANLLAAFAFNGRSPSMPGLSLSFLNRVRDPDALLPSERHALLANRAYWNFDQLRDEEARAAADQALASHPSPDLQLLRLRIGLRRGEFEATLEHAASWIRREAIEPSILAQVQELMGLAAYRLEHWRDAIIHFSDALEADPLMHEARYHRGLAFMRDGEVEKAKQDLFALESHAYELPATFWGDLAFVLGDLGEYEAGREWLDRSLAMYPYDIDGWQERGYQSMKARRNQEAKASFAEAIRIYDEILPYVEEEDEAEDFRELRMSLKQEYTKLDKTWSFQLYAQRTDFDFDVSDLPGDSTQGALKSQGGAMIGYRPPHLGFRNERTFDVFLRLLTDLESGSWRPVSDRYQGGLGIRHKPFVRHNYVFGFERLFKIGDQAEDNWLWRNTFGLEGGERPLRNKTLSIYRRLYAEASYYLDTPRRWIFFGQGNIGPSFQLTQNLLLTAPEGLAVARYQDNDAEGVGTYWYVGPGLNLRLLEGERALTRDRWILNAHAHYVWGRFDNAVERLGRNDFEGWIIGINMTR